MNRDDMYLWILAHLEKEFNQIPFGIRHDMATAIATQCNIWCIEAEQKMLDDFKKLINECYEELVV